MRPTPMDTINSAMVTRQYYAQNDRSGLYNPISPYADQKLRSAPSLFATTGHENERPDHTGSRAIHQTWMGPALRSTMVELPNTFPASRKGGDATPMFTPEAARLGPEATIRVEVLAGAGGMGGGMGGMAWAWVAWAG